MLEKLLVKPTPIAEWQALVDEAKDRHSYSITDEIECYLIFLLMRFVRNPEFTQSILGTDFLKSFEQLKRERLASLRDVGDKCLLLAGLFPGRAQKRRVRISYFVRLGQMAYSSLSLDERWSLAKLYGNLSEHFVMLMDIMHAMREMSEDTRGIDLLQAEELWHDTKSSHALSILRKATHGFLPSGMVSNQTSSHCFKKH